MRPDGHPEVNGPLSGEDVYDDEKECWILGRLESMGLKDISDEGG